MLHGHYSGNNGAELSHSMRWGLGRCLWELQRKALATVSAQQGTCLQANSKQEVILPIQWGFQTVLPMATKHHHHQSEQPEEIQTQNT